MFAQYIVRPCAIGEGAYLTGPLLPYPLRYRNAHDAVDYAHHAAREHGGSVWLLDAKGYPIIAETVTGRDPHPLGG